MREGEARAREKKITQASLCQIVTFCQHQNIKPCVNEDSGSDSDSSSLEEDDPGCLDALEEITEQLDLDAFSTILKVAQKVALTAE